MKRLTWRLLPYRRSDRLLPILGAALILALGGCGGDDGQEGGCPPDSVGNNNFEAEASFIDTVNVTSQSQITLVGFNGRVTITGTMGATSIVISATKRVQSESPQDAQLHLQKLNVDVQNLPNEVRVQTVQPPCNEGRRYLVDYDITMPMNLRTSVTNLNGIITLDSLQNHVAVNNLNGNVTLTNILGGAMVRLLNGTINGTLTIPLNETLDMKTLNGNIDLKLPVNTSAQFLARISTGTITVSNLVLHSEVKTPTSLSGTFGAGQGTISLVVDQFGDITVTGV